MQRQVRALSSGRHRHDPLSRSLLLLLLCSLCSVAGLQTSYEWVKKVEDDLMPAMHDMRFIYFDPAQPTFMWAGLPCPAPMVCGSLVQIDPPVALAHISVFLGDNTEDAVIHMYVVHYPLVSALFTNAKGVFHLRTYKAKLNADIFTGGSAELACETEVPEVYNLEQLAVHPIKQNVLIKIDANGLVTINAITKNCGTIYSSLQFERFSPAFLSMQVQCNEALECYLFVLSGGVFRAVFIGVDRTINDEMQIVSLHTVVAGWANFVVSFAGDSARDLVYISYAQAPFLTVLDIHLSSGTPEILQFGFRLGLLTNWRAVKVSSNTSGIVASLAEDDTGPVVVIFKRNGDGNGLWEYPFEILRPCTLAIAAGIPLTGCEVMRMNDIAIMGDLLVVVTDHGMFHAQIKDSLDENTLATPYPYIPTRTPFGPTILDNTTQPLPPSLAPSTTLPKNTSEPEVEMTDPPRALVPAEVWLYCVYGAMIVGVLFGALMWRKIRKKKGLKVLPWCSGGCSRRAKREELGTVGVSAGCGDAGAFPLNAPILESEMKEVDIDMPPPTPHGGEGILFFPEQIITAE